MAQPKAPPLSIRLPPELLDLVDAWAAGAKITRHAAAVRLIMDGLASHAVPVTHRPGAVKIASAAIEPLRLPRAAPGSRLKGVKK